MRKGHRIVVISAGPGGKEYITDIARKKSKDCEVIIGSAEQLAAAGVSRMQTVYEEWGIENIVKLLERHKGRLVGILVTGDAGIYSLAQRFAERFGEESIEEIVPGVSSIQVAFARIKEPWLNLRVFSYREGPFEGFEEVLRHERSAILCDKEHDSKKILTALEGSGLFERERKIFVCQELTLEDETVMKIHSGDDIEKIEVKRREIVVIINC